MSEFEFEFELLFEIEPPRSQRVTFPDMYAHVRARPVGNPEAKALGKKEPGTWILLVRNKQCGPSKGQ